MPLTIKDKASRANKYSFVICGTKKGELSSQSRYAAFQLSAKIKNQIKRDKLIKNIRERRFLTSIKDNFKKIILKKINNIKNNKKNLSICGINNASLPNPTKEFHLGVKVANNIKNKLKNTTLVEL